MVARYLCYPWNYTCLCNLDKVQPLTFSNCIIKALSLIERPFKLKRVLFLLRLSQRRRRAATAFRRSWPCRWRFRCCGASLRHRRPSMSPCGAAEASWTRSTGSGTCSRSPEPRDIGWQIIHPTHTVYMILNWPGCTHCVSVQLCSCPCAQPPYVLHTCTDLIPLVHINK